MEEAAAAVAGTEEEEENGGTRFTNCNLPDRDTIVHPAAHPGASRDQDEHQHCSVAVRSREGDRVRAHRTAGRSGGRPADHLPQSLPPQQRSPQLRGATSLGGGSPSPFAGGTTNRSHARQWPLTSRTVEPAIKLRLSSAWRPPSSAWSRGCASTMQRARRELPSRQTRPRVCEGTPDPPRREVRSDVSEGRRRRDRVGAWRT